MANKRAKFRLFDVAELIPMFKAVVVGLTGAQANQLRAKLPPGVDLKVISPERALKFQGDSAHVILLTRFVSHKHAHHLRRVSHCPVLMVRAGVVSSTLKAIEAAMLAEAA
jgi:hypothetical protein